MEQRYSSHPFSNPVSISFDFLLVFSIYIANYFIWSCQQCSIDSLLECTIKHMLFLKNVTKDKLNKFTDTKTKVIEF